MSDQIEYCINRASAAEIAAHLLRCDSEFKPRLSARVDIQVYAAKIHARAMRFEARIDGALVGLVATYCNDLGGRPAYITSVSVLPPHQGQGIAAQLMRKCLEHVQHLGLGQIELEVDERSLPAIGLYRKLGFATAQANKTSLKMSMTL
jgi:ribosomal protein S18 acetylase RimI-like enzyme